MTKKVNVLTDRLPDTVTVYGREIKLDTDFRKWIIVSDILSDCAEYDITETAGACALAVCPEAVYPTESAEFLTKLSRFASCTDMNGMSSDAEETGEPLIDFTADAELILGAFLSSYGIDLTVTRMHWWKFIALLRALPEETELKRVIRLRDTDTGSIRDDELRRRVRRAKAAVRIRRRKAESRAENAEEGEEAVNGG